MSLILLVLVVGVALGYLRGGRLREISNVRLGAVWLVWLAFALQLALPFLGDARDTLRVPIVAASFLAASVWIVMMWRRLERVLLRAGVALVALGWLLNFTVIGLNNGMPVSPQALERVGLPTEEIEEGDLSKHVAMDEDTQLRFLGDVIPLPLFGTLRKAISIGDVVMLAGLLVFVPTAMTRRREEPAPAAEHAAA
jgi:hypothetical protein